MLDVGGGSEGTNLPVIYHGSEHWVLDICPSSRDRFIQLDARRLVDTPALQAQYDVVYCSHTLEHFDPADIPTVVAGMRHALRDDGWLEVRVPDLLQLARVLVATDNPDQPLYAIGDGSVVTCRDLIYGFPRDIQWHGDALRHRHGFTPQSLYRLLTTFFDRVGIGQHNRGYELRAVAMCNAATPFPYQQLP